MTDLQVFNMIKGRNTFENPVRYFFVPLKIFVLREDRAFQNTLPSLVWVQLHSISWHGIPLLGVDSYSIPLNHIKGYESAERISSQAYGSFLVILHQFCRQTGKV